MKKLLALMLLCATPVMADNYLVGIPTESMSELLIRSDVPFPPSSVIQDGLVWGVIEEDSKYTSMYVENAEELVWIGTDKYRTLQKVCKERNVSVDCIRQALSYEEAAINQETASR